MTDLRRRDYLYRWLDVYNKLFPFRPNRPAATPSDVPALTPPTQYRRRRSRKRAKSRPALRVPTPFAIRPIFTPDTG